MEELVLLLKQIELAEEKIKAIKAVNRNTRAAEIRLQKELQELMKKVERDVIKELLKLQRVPSDEATRNVLMRYFFLIQEKYQEVYVKAALEAAQRGSNRSISRLQRQGSSVQFDKVNEKIKNMIKTHAFEASQSTLNRLQGDVMETLAKAYEKGVGIDEAAEMLRNKFTSIKDHELVRIARTEINSIQNLGAHQVNIDLGVQYKMWITAEDERVRDGSKGSADHVKMHGQIAPIDEPFSNGLMHPGDRNGPIEEWINCRCVLVSYILPVGKKPPTGKTWFYEWELEDIA